MALSSGRPFGPAKSGKVSKSKRGTGEDALVTSMEPSPPVPILMYHKVAPVDPRSAVPGHYVPPALFRRQMRVLKALGFVSVRLADLFESNLPKRPVVITFDDGYENFALNALPALRAVGYRSTVFLVANQIGGSDVWDHAEAQVQERLLSAKQIKAAQAEGTDFGSHTLDHADLPACNRDEAWRQIADSKASLEGVLGEPVTTFCYPYGRTSPEVRGMVEEAGYRYACSTQKGANTREADRLALRRINVRSDSWTPVFLFKLLRSVRYAR